VEKRGEVNKEFCASLNGFEAGLGGLGRLGRITIGGFEE